MSTHPYAFLAVASLAAALSSACTRDQPNRCSGAPFNNCLNGDGGSRPCTTNDDCEAPTAVCDVNDSKTCVQCVDPDDTSACVGTSPVCGPDNACQPCSAHVQCASNACLPDGSCAAEADVAYVQMGGTGSECTRATPCGTLDVAVNMTTKAVVKIAAGLVKDNKKTVIDGKRVTILADTGAQLDRDLDGSILEITSDGADVQISDLEITGASGAADAAITLIANGGTPKLRLTRVIVTGNQGTGGGISATGGSLTVEQSTLSENSGIGISASGSSLIVEQSTLSGNQGIGISTSGGSLIIERSTLFTNQSGGISVSGSGATFNITNNFIFRNGNNNASSFGGLSLGIAVAGSNRLAFNTIVDNEAAINSGGIVCNAPTFAGPNNIIARNILGGSTTAADAQTFGACTYPTSKIQTDVNGLAFEDPESPAPFVYKLTTPSTAIDQATTPVPMVDVDNEGDPRPQGAQNDIGADEFRR